MDMEGILMDDLLRADAEAPPAAASMSPGGAGSSSSAAATAAVGSEDESAAATDDLLRRGPWTVEEDELLVSHIAAHGEGRWNSLARTAGLRRTGKSCRLRWLNYLRPDVRRGNISAREQLLILDLHSRWGNRWSKIALHLPGRTDNEIKNYWRTRVQKHARQLRCDVGSARFRDVVRHVWMPRLVERIQAEDEAAAGAGAQAAAAEAAPVGFARLPPATTTASAPPAACQWTLQSVHRAAEDYCTYSSDPAAAAGQINTPPASSPEENSSSAPHSSLTTDASPPPHAHGGAHHHHYSSCYTTSSVSATATTTPTNNEGCGGGAVVQSGGNVTRPTAATGDDVLGGSWSELLATAGRDDGDDLIGLPDFGLFGDLEDSSLWSLEDLCLHQLC